MKNAWNKCNHTYFSTIASAVLQIASMDLEKSSNSVVLHKTQMESILHVADKQHKFFQKF